MSLRDSGGKDRLSDPEINQKIYVRRQISAMIIRQYRPEDLCSVITLFKEAVSALNTRHYSREQVAAWTAINEDTWKKSLEENIAYVAEIDSIIVGIADMTHAGYLDRLYVHKNYQARGVALRLIKIIEQEARVLGLSKITTDCSITARIPAERIGFVLVKEQTVECRGMTFINYAMEKKVTY